MVLRRLFSTVLVVGVLGASGVLVTGCESGPSVLSGHLTTGGATPAANVDVRVYTTGSKALVVATTTDASGNYHFTASALAAGTYRLRFGDDDWWQGATSWSDAADVAVSGGSPATVSADLLAGAISGTVTDGSGPVSGALVQVYPTTHVGADFLSPAVSSVHTAPDGTYTVVGLVAGRYRVRISAAGDTTRYVSTTGPVQDQFFAEALTVAAGATTGGANVVLATQSTISGTVETHGLALGTSIVIASLAQNHDPLAYAVTDGSGAFTIDGLDNVDYVLTVLNLSDPSYAATSSGPAGFSFATAPQETVTPPVAGSIVAAPLTLVTADCAAVVQAGPNLPGVDLTNKVLRGCDLHGFDLSGATLAATNLNGANLRGANLSNLHVQGTVELGADLYGVDLSGSNLSPTDVRGNPVGSVDARGARSGDITLGPDVMPGGYTLFHGFMLGTQSDLTGANLAGLDFTGHDLSSDIFTGANVAGTVLGASDLTGAYGSGLVGTPASLPAGWAVVRGNLLGEYTPGDRTDLRDADLAGLNLSWGTMVSAELTDADLTGTNLTGVDLESADAPGANLTGANLSIASAQGINLTGADLTNVNLGGTDLSGATLTGVVSSGIVGTPAALPSGWSIVGGVLTHS